ncbi:MAG: cupin domain-containing protein [Phycisphaerales bacterium]|nr:cupin domain-containing protein [Phycisphaerales bacterium]
MTTPDPALTRCANPAIIKPDGGDTIVIVGDKARILADASATGGQCTVFEAITPPGVGPPLHSHEREDEYFYIIEGTVKFSVNGQIHVGSAGTFLLAPRGSIHTFMNAGPKPSRMLIWVTPAGLEQPFRENAALFKHNPQASPDQIAEIFDRFGVRFHGPPLDVSSA